MLNVEAYVFKQALIFRDNYCFHLINFKFQNNQPCDKGDS